tara:strand:+ start:60 stop:359 length:300 start_codon:yes stop_codon:yes gene_type:complete
MKLIKLVIVPVFLFMLIACASHTHIVGDGPKAGMEETARQYYILFGLVPLNKVDTNALIGDAANFKITTEANVVDAAIGIAAGLIIPTTISSRTVTVTK